MIHIIITSFKEPKSTVRAVRKVLEQDIKEKFEIIVADPFPEVEEFLNKELGSEIKKGKVRFWLDPGAGKSYALNLLLGELWSDDKNDLIISTDGDVFVSKNAINEIIDKFKDEKVGCVTGKPVCSDSPRKKYGYWAKTLYAAIDNVRLRLAREKKFFQCSGYLFAWRNGVLEGFPEEVPEDAIIPYIFWKRGFRIDYANKAEVYIKYPNNWKDWVKQRVRTIKAHENLPKTAPDMPRTKSFSQEIKEGAFFAIKQPRNPIEFFWISQLFAGRLYIYLKSFWDIRRKKVFNPEWREEEINSTKPLD